MEQPAPSAPEADRPGTAEAAGDWALRPWLLAGFLGLAALLIWWLADGHDDVPWRIATCAFLFFGAISAALTLEHDRWKAPAMFALAIGAIMAGLAWRAVQYGESLPDEQYGFAAGVLAVALFVPLYQAGFLQRRLATPYGEAHSHAWTDALVGAGALAFTGLSWIVLAILSELFQLLKIDLLDSLMDEAWFGATFSGLAFGAALGTLRNQVKVLGTLQAVVMLVLSLLAVPVALGLLLFLLATALSGPQVLWEATRSATPVLLACGAGAFLLVNAIIRDEDVAMSRSRIMRVAALVLAAIILPLAIFAAVSMGLRLDQYGLAPERLWGLVAILVACICGVAYWMELVRGWKSGWPARLRTANFHLALVACVLAMLLALPVLDFGAISTRNQLARLEAGRVAVEDFDFAALRWDFGEPGRRALRGLAEGEGETAQLAEAALAQTQRPYFRPRPEQDFALRVQPESPQVRQLVLDYLRNNSWQCSEQCLALDLGPAEGGGRDIALVQGLGYERLTLPQANNAAIPQQTELPRLKEGSRVEIRELTRRYIVVDGEPVGAPLD